jgi:uncharacterized membrane protein HdeD (DUF308 family)
MLVQHLARNWWIAVLRGIISVLFGIGALVWPGPTLVVLVAFIGAYLFVDGVLAFAAAIRFRHDRERWIPLAIEGLFGVAVGVVTFFAPGITALAWVYTIATWAIVTGVLEIWAAVSVKMGSASQIWLGLAGVASILLGLAFILMPLAGLLVWVWLIGAYAIVFGVLLIGFGLQLRAPGAAPAGRTSPT